MLPVRMFVCSASDLLFTESAVNERKKMVAKVMGPNQGLAHKKHVRK